VPLPKQLKIKIMYNKNYLSKRPFLIINTKFLPGPGAKTSTPGWTETSGWNVTEEVAIVDRITNKHRTYATLIIDILEAKCIKNGFEDSKNDDASAHFMTKYKEQIKEAVGIWLEREAQKLAASQVLNIEDARKTVKDATVLAAAQLQEASAGDQVAAITPDVELAEVTEVPVTEPTTD
jgi:hypothetical protein